MDSPTPEGLAAKAEALWPRWAAHLAALAAGAKPADPAGSGVGARLAQALEALWLNRGEAACAAADRLWARALGREEGGLLASVAALSAVLAAFRAGPDACLELAAATHLAILRCAVLLPGSGTKQQLGSAAPTRLALEQLAFKTCPDSLLGVVRAAAAKNFAQSVPYLLLADPSLPHQALLLANALSCGHHHETESPGLPGLLEELEWVRGWLQALDGLAEAGALAGPQDEMHEALAFICARAVSAGREDGKREQVIQSLMKAPQLLPWYVMELLRNSRDEILSAAQGGREVCRGHWIELQMLVLFWSPWQQDIAGHIAAQPQLQDWWLEAIAAFTAVTEAACRSGACPFTWAPLSALHCCTAVVSNDSDRLQLDPAFMVTSLDSFSLLHSTLHAKLLASDAAAAQRTEAAAVATARCCLRVARAIDGWQGELAMARQAIFEAAVSASVAYTGALVPSPAFSCEAALRQGSPRVPGRRAVAAVIEVTHLAAEALQAVAGIPSLRAAHIPGLPRGGPGLAVAIGHKVVIIASRFLRQTLPGRQVLLTSCIVGEQVQPVLQALLALLRAQRKAVTWLQGPGRPDAASQGEVAKRIRTVMESSISSTVNVALDLFKRMPRPDNLAEGGLDRAARLRVAVAHIALSAALATHTLPRAHMLSLAEGHLLIPAGFGLAWKLLKEPFQGGGGSQWSSVRASAARLVCASLQSVVTPTDYTSAEAARMLLPLLACINIQGSPMAAALHALASGMYSHLAGWAIRVARRPTSLQESCVSRALLQLEQVLQMACRAADSLLLSGGDVHFAAANKCLSAQIQNAMGMLTESPGQPPPRKQLEAHASAVRHAWERRRDRLLPAMERAARCGSAFVVTWQAAVEVAGVGGSDSAAVAARCHTCPLPAVHQALALAGGACANPHCTHLASGGGAGEDPAGERLQRCRGCRVAGYCCAACGREDWGRHRPACNALRHLRSGTASVLPAVGAQQV